MSNDRRSQRYLIGYALAPKKEQTFIQPSLVTKASERGIDLIRIDPYKPLIEQGPFDCIIHKLYGPDWNQQLLQFSSRNPGVRVIDPPELIERLHNRISMLEVVSDMKIDLNSKGKLSVPKQAVVSGPTEVHELRFPLIAKPLEANGTPKSHQMYLIFDTEGLQVLEEAAPMVLQEFVNHGGVVFKVYVAGSSVKCVKRKSLPDISQEKMKSLKGFLPFSQVSSNAVDDDDREVDLEKIEVPCEGFVAELARAMREALGLNLFNFDLIRENDDNISARGDSDRYLVIDINYLPGYAKLQGYVSFLMDFFLNLANNGESS
ncbi:hypothetical protein AB3S75_022600 [Citrus x aurantiifolia]